MNDTDTIHSFSKRLIEAQGPIRILESVRWTDEVRDQFLHGGGKVMPKVDQAWYQTRTLGFDPHKIQSEFTQLEQDVARVLGKNHPAGAILLRMCREYKMTVQMLEHRGKPKFGKYSRELFGSSRDPIHSDGPTLADLAEK